MWKSTSSSTTTKPTSSSLFHANIISYFIFLFFVFRFAMIDGSEFMWMNEWKKTASSKKKIIWNQIKYVLASVTAYASSISHMPSHTKVRFFFYFYVVCRSCAYKIAVSVYCRREAGGAHFAWTNAYLYNSCTTWHTVSTFTSRSPPHSIWFRIVCLCLSPSTVRQV